jgi:DNA-binding PadR family transcriptional regulator
MNGYQIMQELEERSGGGWRPSPGSVYPALAQLEDEELVRVDEVDGRKTYALTDAGRAYVEERKLGAPWEQLVVEGEVGSLFKELQHVHMAAAQIGHIGDARQVAEARKLLASTRRSLYGLLAEDDADA